jgi:hypothetical protein
MPVELSKAHQKLDSEVLSTYGLHESSSDTEILECLFTNYREQLEQIESK